MSDERSGPAPHATTARQARARRMRIGSREVVTEGIPQAIIQDLYHYFMMVSWPQLFATLGAFFLVFDTFFGCFYYLVPGCIANVNPPGFLGDFFFSVETLATVGYGDMHPQTLYGHSIAMVEIFTGLMMLALITGLMFARFSRPKARFLFARYAVVRPIEGKLTLMFRAANARQNVVQEASARLRMLRDEVTGEGYRLRRIVDLPLMRAEHPAFAFGWNIMHVIDEASPLRTASDESLRAASASFILSLSGTDETTGQVLMARQEYTAAAILWNRTFRDILEWSEDGGLHIDYGKFHDVEPLEPPPAAAPLRRS
ncbi:MAG TPA: ion channel [Steroidobacteraceae bacterium]|nr:ion channel [Steroidobacteraceae bacterium]